MRKGTLYIWLPVATLCSTQALAISSSDIPESGSDPIYTSDVSSLGSETPMRGYSSPIRPTAQPAVLVMPRTLGAQPAPKPILASTGVNPAPLAPTPAAPRFSSGAVPQASNLPTVVPAAATSKAPPVTPTAPTPGAPAHKSIAGWTGMDAGEPGSLAAAIMNGTPWIDLRYRYEVVSQDGIHRHAIASTVRSRVGYESGIWNDFKVGFEVQNLRDIGAEHFNNGINGKTLYPGVTDPEETELRQGYVAYEGIPGSEIKVGRQLINLDNVRWIGSPEWRQLSQDYDALTAYSTYFPGTTLFYGYVRQVNRSGGDDSPIGTYIGNTHLFNASHEFLPELKVAAYTYLLDFQSGNPANNSGSTATYGLRFTGSHALNKDITLSYSLEGAHQNSYGDNPAGISEYYYLIEPAFTAYGFTGKLGYEMLEGNGTTAVQTPLATNHSFVGWADKFTITPNNGLLDKYVSLSYKLPFGYDWIKGTSLTGVYRNYHSDKGDISDGHEWDGLIEHTFFGHYTTSVEVADYRADHLFTDTFKVMAFLTAKY